MKRKIITNTYLKEATKYQIKLFLDEKDNFISVKKLINVTDKFIISDNIVAMDNGYYILEIIPKHENYALRVFFNDKKEIIEYYFDIIKESGLDEVYKVPYFDDLYLMKNFRIFFIIVFCVSFSFFFVKNISSNVKNRNDKLLISLSFINMKSIMGYEF